jgi:hypothetical protein
VSGAAVPAGGGDGTGGAVVVRPQAHRERDREDSGTDEADADEQ